MSPCHVPELCGLPPKAAATHGPALSPHRQSAASEQRGGLTTLAPLNKRRIDLVAAVHWESLKALKGFGVPFGLNARFRIDPYVSCIIWAVSGNWGSCLWVPL